ncbi:hypothetical protein P3102_10720 [Amycolatopsis sp. QT-25]|uniref:hypothetical protein n=1 Tax=Amycolatopsis sp. QT-25 TaxID=3034022 RepID=UPI0023ECE656|nr:hypothetical protein [Amycolatopsis sp. QT-25]WET81640.1 hypothetical protein P3102_10720 [Amycolatopsis sp. QT-25]
MRDTLGISNTQLPVAQIERSAGSSRHETQSGTILTTKGPDKQLWIGICVLLYPTIVGIVLPILAMRDGPTTFTGYIRTLAFLFISGLVVLIGYMAYLASRLSRRHKQATRQRLGG